MAERLTHKERFAKAKREYRLGQKSVRTIAEEIGVSHTTVNKWVKKNGWVQDKSREVLERTRAALSTPPPIPDVPEQVVVSSEGSTQDSTVDRDSDLSRDPEADPEADDERAVEVAVQTNLAVIRGHRKHLSHKLGLVDMFSRQLEDAGNSRERIIDMIMQEDVPHQRRVAMLKAVSLPTHAAVIRDLSVALRNMIPLERQAFGLDEKSAPPPRSLSENLTEEQKQVLQRVADALAIEVTKQ